AARAARGRSRTAPSAAAARPSTPASDRPTGRRPRSPARRWPVRAVPRSGPVSRGPLLPHGGRELVQQLQTSLVGRFLELLQISLRDLAVRAAGDVRRLDQSLLDPGVDAALRDGQELRRFDSGQIGRPALALGPDHRTTPSRSLAPTSVERT